MVRQTDPSKLLALGLLNYADDEGYFYAEAAMIRAALRPLDEDSTIVRAALDELCAIEFIQMVEHATHGPIGRIVSFLEHQRVDRPNKSKIKHLWNSSNDRRMIVDESSPEGIREGKGREQGVCVRANVVPTLKEVLDYCNPASGIDPAIGETWWNESEGRGWVDRTGQPVKKWRPALMSYFRKWESNDARNAANRNGNGVRPKDKTLPTAEDIYGPSR